MPLVRVSLLEGTPDSFKNKIGDSIHQALVETIQIPQQDRFQVFTNHTESGFFYDAEYLNINRTNHLVIVQITWHLPGGRYHSPSIIAAHRRRCHSHQRLDQCGAPK